MPVESGRSEPTQYNVSDRKTYSGLCQGNVVVCFFQVKNRAKIWKNMSLFGQLYLFLPISHLNRPKILNIF